MNKLATASFTTTDIPTPTGVTVAGFIATLLLADAVVESKAADSGTVAFTITAPGTYTVSVARVADSGEAIAAPAVSDPFTIEPEVVMVSVPLKVVVTLSDPVAVPDSVAVAVA